MKKMNFSVLRIILSLVLGIVLFFWPTDALHYLIIMIGVLFIIPGFFSILNYLLRDKRQERQPQFPLEGVGSVFLGILLVIIPDSFVNMFMYVLAAVVIAGGVQQVVELVRTNKKEPVHWGFFVIPVLLIISSIVIISGPQKFIAYIFKIFGFMSLVYSLTSFIQRIRWRKVE